MIPDPLTIIGSVLAAALGGGTVSGVLTYVRDRRRDRQQAQGERTVGAISSLERLNDRLTDQVAELQTLLDEERRKRRELEDVVDQERRERMRERGELSLRIAILEEHLGSDAGNGGPDDGH